MKKILSLLAVIILSMTLTSCGKYTFEDVYRYPCQDPDNWTSPDCLPPRCEAFGICAKDVMKDTPLYDKETGQVNLNETSK